MSPEKARYYVASFSGGKDSTAMVLELIRLGYPLDEVLCCDTTMEFPAMYRHIERVQKVVEAAGVKFTTLRAEYDFEYYMLHYQPKRKNPKLANLRGFSWPGPTARWCTGVLKTRIVDKYLKTLRAEYNVYQYIGIAADEGYRLARENNQDPNHIHPLVDWGWDEAKAMAYCRELGYDWEGLYEIFSRVSCWCCPLQPLGEMKKLRDHFPDLWAHLKWLDSQTWRSYLANDWSVERLEKRFDLEDALEARGYSLRDRQFYTDLKRYCFSEEVTIGDILDDRQKDEYEQLTIFTEE